MSVRTRFLARLFGLFMVIVGLAMLAEQAELAAGVEALLRDPAAMLILSLLCLGAGLATVLGHQVWAGGAVPVFITLIGWVILLRGVLLLFMPADLLEAFMRAFLRRDLLYASGAASLVLGAFLTYAGFRPPTILSDRP